RDVMIFLRSHDVSSGYAVKIFKRYGKDALRIVKENPYKLAEDVFGIGFVLADRIAENIGIERDSLIRASAGILYTLNKLSEEGHLYYPADKLIQKSSSLLKIDNSIIKKALNELISEKKIVREGESVYLAAYHFSENSVAQRLKALVSEPVSFKKFDFEKALTETQKDMPFKPAEKQLQAIRCAFENKAMVITGGPGTGKTTIISMIIKIFSRSGMKVLLAAPTGRAAKKMSEATGREAKTIHRLLEYSIKSGFKKNASNPLDCGLLIIDESSMIDIILMHHLLKAVPPHSNLIFVGDVNQLPSVGPGDVLGDIIKSSIVPVVELKEIFRQARKSLIVRNAHRINKGLMPLTKDNEKELSDFYFIESENPHQVLNIILELAKNRIPQRFALDPIDDIQVLSPMHKGTVGASSLNSELQKILNPHSKPFGESKEFRQGDKVMQIRNNYEKDVFNGDIGKIIKIDPTSKKLTICFEDRYIEYEWGEWDEVMPAYAVSVHKSQGSEYPAVIVPVVMQHYILLRRNLIYTAVTRGRKLTVLVGSKKALAMAIKNNSTAKRFTQLKERLKDK
ncbi:MAG: SF1B family DNA helicase RecD2, partial [Elusimicrobiota bacterium]